MPFEMQRSYITRRECHSIEQDVNVISGRSMVKMAGGARHAQVCPDMGMAMCMAMAMAMAMHRCVQISCGTAPRVYR